MSSVGNINSIYDISLYETVPTQQTSSPSKTPQTSASPDTSNTVPASTPVNTANETSSIPTLEKPNIMDRDITCYSTLPSFGANYLALINEVASEQSTMVNQMRMLETEALIDKINEEADTIRSKAVTQLVTGVVSGSLSIAQGVASSAITAKGMVETENAAQTAKTATIEQGTKSGTAAVTDQDALNLIAKADNAAALTRQQADMALNSRIQTFNTSMSGTNTIIDSIGQYVTSQYDAELKEQEGEAESIRAMQQALDSLDESLKTLMEKALSTQEAIQANMNQTRTKILG